MRTMLVLLAAVVAGTACSTPAKNAQDNRVAMQAEQTVPSATSPAPLGDNEVTIDVQCNARAVTVTVDPFQAHAAKGEPIFWHIKANAHVTELDINSAGGKWPFTEQLPYKSKTGQPASATKRRADWKSGDTAQYKISGTCKGHPFVLDPEMIVD